MLPVYHWIKQQHIRHIRIISQSISWIQAAWPVQKRKEKQKTDRQREHKQHNKQTVKNVSQSVIYGNCKIGFCSKFLAEYNGKRIWKSANICQSYERMYSGTVFDSRFVLSVPAAVQFLLVVLPQSCPVIMPLCLNVVLYIYCAPFIRRS